ncbi:MAG: right-handed parallel beta-helix repeat-containing protein [Candidatus Woesearchaeota archaeon]
MIIKKISIELIIFIVVLVFISGCETDFGKKFLSPIQDSAIKDLPELEYLTSLPEGIPFERTVINDIDVYYYQRKLGDAIVEKDLLIYNWDQDLDKFVEINRHWRDDIPNKLPKIKVSKDEAESKVKGIPLRSSLYIISPESDVYLIEPTPKDPSWVVRSIYDYELIISVIDAITGEFLGYGIPPPYTGFSLTGPQHEQPCSGLWSGQAENARYWFDAMGYSTNYEVWPTESKVRSHIESYDTAVFYETAHGDSLSFNSGCINGEHYEYTSAYEVGEWIEDYPAMPFTFIGSCDGMCYTGPGSFSYAFRKGRDIGSVTVGYCKMHEDQCDICWDYAVMWQNRMFQLMDIGWTAGSSFYSSLNDYSPCAECVKIDGDNYLKLVTPYPIKRTYGCGDEIRTNVVLNYDLIDCSADGVIIGADDITIDCDGHRINGIGEGLGININNKNNVNIRNCEISNFNVGISLLDSSDAYLYENRLINNARGISLVYSSSNNEINSNTLSNNGDGIYLGGNDVHNNHISYNFGCDNDRDLVCVNIPTDNTGYDNNFLVGSGCDNIDYYSCSCDGNCECGNKIFRDTILQNDIINCVENGLEIVRNDVTLDCNGHKLTGVGNSNGVSVEGRYGAKVENCLIENFRRGIWITYSEDSDIYNNNINNTFVGIHLYDYVNYNYIHGNIVSGSDYGIVCESNFYDIYNVIDYNVACNNSYYDLYCSGNSINNFWGYGNKFGEVFNCSDINYDFCYVGLECGDGECNDNEICSTCPEDCGACPSCGNGECQEGETDINCPIDCGCQATECDELAPGGCWCDSLCVEYGDCCSDACLECGYCPGGKSLPYEQAMISEGGPLYSNKQNTIDKILNIIKRIFTSKLY